MPLITDETYSRVAELAEVPQEDLERAFADGQRLIAYISKHEGLDEGDLRRWGEANDLGPDRITVALAVLRSTKRIHDVPSLVLPSRAAGVADLLDIPGGLNALSKPTLDAIAADVDLPGRSSKTKAELVEALGFSGGD